MTPTDINLRKPDTTSLIKAADGIVFQIVTETSNEPFASATKKKYLCEIIERRDLLGHDWVALVEALSRPILDILSKKTKLLPRNQYEESLAQLNFLFNQEEYRKSLLDKFMKCLAAEDIDMDCVWLIIYQLFSRASEEFQALIFKEMRLTTPSVSSLPLDPTTTMSDAEKKLFCDKICTVVRNYYSKAISISNEVWQTRCECLRQRFMIFFDDIQKSDIVKKLLWLEGKICIADNVLEFFKGLECVIQKSVVGMRPVLPDAIITSLIQSQHDLINIWHSITSGYLSEIDSLLFMRDFVKIFVNLSVRLEEFKLQREEGQQRLQKFATRDNLKRN